MLDVDEGKIGNTKCQNIIIICEENKADCSREQLTYDEGEEEKSKEIVRRHFVQSELYDKWNETNLRGEVLRSAASLESQQERGVEGELEYSAQMSDLKKKFIGSGIVFIALLLRILK